MKNNPFSAGCGLKPALSQDIIWPLFIKTSERFAAGMLGVKDYNTERLSLQRGR